MKTAEWHQRGRSGDFIVKLKKKHTFLPFYFWLSEFRNIYRNYLKRYLICAIILRIITFLQKLQNKIKKTTTLKCKKNTFLFEKIDKNVKINSLFLGNS